MQYNSYNNIYFIVYLILAYFYIYVNNYIDSKIAGYIKKMILYVKNGIEIYNI